MLQRVRSRGTRDYVRREQALYDSMLLRQRVLVPQSREGGMQESPTRSQSTTDTTTRSHTTPTRRSKVREHSNVRQARPITSTSPTPTRGLSHPDRLYRLGSYVLPSCKGIQASGHPRRFRNVSWQLHQLIRYPVEAGTMGGDCLGGRKTLDKRSYQAVRACAGNQRRLCRSMDQGDRGCCE